MKGSMILCFELYYNLCGKPTAVMMIRIFLLSHIHLQYI